MVSNWFFDHLQLFLVQPFNDLVPNKGSALVMKFIILSTRVKYVPDLSIVHIMLS